MEIKLKQAMCNHPMTVRHKDDLSAAYNRMKREGYRHLPVIDDSGDLVGIISDRDFKRAMWPVSAPDAHGLPDGPTFRKDAKVSEYMTWPVVSLPESTDLELAVKTMLDKKISAIVVTEDNQMTGIITHEDLLKILVSLLSKPPALGEKVAAFTYGLPLGKVSELLSTAGI